MILNAYAILDLFVVGLRMLAALAVVYLSAMTLCKAEPGHHGLGTRENSGYLLLLLSILLLGLNVVSWPLLYLLLQSYVPQWPGVMCVYGVTRIGSGSLGVSRLLPDLIALLQILKPAVVFCSGLWLVLYQLNRNTKTALLFSRVVIAQLALGLLSLADAGAEAAYLLIPKQEQFLSVGCCTAAIGDRAASARLALLPSSAQSLRQALLPAYLVSNALLIGTLFSSSRRTADGRSVGLGWLLVLAAGALLIGGVFLVEVVAPTVLHLPLHRCPYDLIPRAPDIVFGVALFVSGFFFIGWACAASLIALNAETRLAILRQQHLLLAGALKCFSGSLVLISCGLALA
jgi:hypothetical protein